MKKMLLIILLAQAISVFGAASSDAIRIKIVQGDPITDSPWSDSAVKRGLGIIEQNIQELAELDPWWADIKGYLNSARNTDEVSSYVEAISDIAEKMKEREGKNIAFSIQNAPNLASGNYDLRKIMDNVALGKRNIFDGAFKNKDYPVMYGTEEPSSNVEGADLVKGWRSVTKASTYDITFDGVPFLNVYEDVLRKINNFIYQGNVKAARTYLSNLKEKTKSFVGKMYIETILAGRVVR